MLIEKNVNLLPLNTMGVSAHAAYFAIFKNTQELIDVLKEGRALTSKILCLGGGSNILFTQDFDGLVLKNEIQGVQLLEENNESVVLRVGAGVIWHDFVEHCLAKEWAGVENLALIPGTVGAAPIQNIGAYGVEVKSVIESVEMVEIATGEFVEWTGQDCQFGYRDSRFKREAKGKYIITAVIFKLSKNAPINTSYGAIEAELKRVHCVSPKLHDVAQAVMAIRRSKLPDPKILGNAGSFFKNPVVPEAQFVALKAVHPKIVGYPDKPGSIKLAAGWLIEHAGLKGLREGSCGVHQEQALVLVNYGGAQGQDLLALSERVKKAVRDHFQVDLETEVNIL